MKNKAFLLLIVIIIMFSGCAEGTYTNNSSEEAVIGVDDDSIDITVDECITVLNTNIEKKNLDLIQKEYQISQYEGCIMYKSIINDKLMIRFVQSREDANKIKLIQLICLESYENQIENISIKASDEDHEVVAKYYDIVCHIVEPGFATYRFLKHNKNNGGVYKETPLVFSFNMNVSNVEVDYEEEVRLYQVFSSNEFFSKYENDLWDDGSQYFY